MKLLAGEEARRMEPSLSEKVTMALYSPNTGVTCPYDLAIAYGK